MKIIRLTVMALGCVGMNLGADLPVRGRAVELKRPKPLARPVPHVPIAHPKAASHASLPSHHPVHTVHIAAAAPPVASRHRGTNPASMGVSAALVNRNAGGLDGRQVHRRP